VLDGTIRRRTVCVAHSTWERYCNCKRTICVFGSPLCLAIEINDVPRRSHQNVNLFAAPPRRTAPFGIGLSNGWARSTNRSDVTQSRKAAKSKKRNLIRTVF
jgi:hypothetical protein